MKNAPLIFSIAAVVIALAAGIYSLVQNPGTAKNAVVKNSDSTSVSIATSGIVYVDLDRIVQEYDMASDLGAVVETKVKNISARKPPARLTPAPQTLAPVVVA